MKQTPLDHGLDPYLIVEPEGIVRPPGLHASDIYNALYQQLDPKRYRAEEGNPLYLAQGLAWERYFEQVLARAGINCIRPEPMRSSLGYWYSPDLLVCNGDDRIGEIKLTTMGVTDDLSHPKFQKYLHQGMTYCYEMGIPRWRLYGLFQVGDWRENIEPQLKAWDVEFTARELHEARMTNVNFARSRRMIR